MEAGPSATAFGSEISRESVRRELGLIALDRDVVIETDLHRVLGGHVDVLTTRIPLREVGSREALEELESHLEEACLLLSSSHPELIAFGCTSGVAVIGEDTIRRRIGEAIAAPVVDPLTAMANGFQGMGIDRIAVITPYPAAVSGLLVDWFQDHGFEVRSNLRIPTTARSYAEIPAQPIIETIQESARTGVDGVAIACTDLRVIHLIDGLESRFDVPVVTSNQALSWAAAGALGLDLSGPGQLFSATAS